MEAVLTPQQLYETSVKQLSIVERLQLVKLVLDDLMHDPTRWVVQESDSWSTDDLQDLAQASLVYADSIAGEEQP